MAEQDYQPYRSALLTKAELSELNQLAPKKPLRSIALLWLQILFAWTVSAVFPTWWIITAAAIVVGNRYYSLFIIGHDGLHRRLHPRIQSNDLRNDLLILGAIGAITRINRKNHMNHHGALGTPSDPDTYKYAWRGNIHSTAYWFSFSGIPFVMRAVINVFAVGRTTRIDNDSYSLRDLAILIGWQIALLSGLTLCFGWWGYLVMWWVPVYVFAYAADITRVFCEHSVPTPDELPLADRLVTFEGSAFELAVFAPMNMNHHVAHHLWPSIPYYNLPAATSILYARARSLPPGTQQPVVRGGYFKYLRDHAAGARNKVRIAV